MIRFIILFCTLVGGVAGLFLGSELGGVFGHTGYILSTIGGFCIGLWAGYKLGKNYFEL